MQSERSQKLILATRSRERGLPWRHFSRSPDASSSRLPHLARCTVDGPSHALVGSAATDVIRHLGVNVFVREFRVAPDQGSRLHDHPSLAIPALRNVFFDPSLLTRMLASRRQSFNC